MSKEEIKNYIENTFYSDLIPSLKNFIRIPSISKWFDPNWEKNQYLDQAGDLICTYAKNLQLKNSTIELLKDPGRSPFVFIDVSSSRPNDDRTILMYCHLDKQPAGEGWDSDKGPFKPVIVDNKLYGRGAVDDGYAPFSAILAIKCCQELNIPTPRIILIVEGAEESDSLDLEYYFSKLKPIYGNISLFVAMDSNCEDNDHIWATTSLRGFASLKITIKSLSRKIQSDFYSGTVPDNYMILRKIIEKIRAEDGTVLIDEFKYPEDKIPERRQKEIKTLEEEVGEKYKQNIPLFNETKPLKEEIHELIMNNLWRPSASILGLDGINSKNDNDQLIDSLSALIEIRLPPYVDGKIGSEKVKEILKEFKPFNCEIECEMTGTDMGFDLLEKNFSLKLENILNNASNEFFGKKLCCTGSGVSVPFLTIFQQNYPEADIANLGIAGRDCCEHGPNEFVDLEVCKKFIMSLVYMLSRY
ncbi:MAG: M20/M25/M40 family metallo-hydrolase [archaeon]|nr:M20/M25/M40 family metallo-hydrolase [archaeon]